VQGCNFVLKSEGYQFMGPEPKREKNGLNGEEVSPLHPTLGSGSSSPAVMAMLCSTTVATMSCQCAWDVLLYLFYSHVRNY